MNYLKTMLSVIVVVVVAFFAAHAGAETETAETQRLDKIIEKQDQILRALAEIKEELNVVKIRATNR